MKKPPYFWRALLNGFVWLPLLFQVLVIVFGVLVAALESLASRPKSGEDDLIGVVVLGIPCGALFLFHCVRLGRGTIRAAAAKTNATASSAFFADEPRFALRYLPVLLLAAYTLLAALVPLLQPAPESGALFGDFATVFTLSHLPACMVLHVVYMFGVPSPWLYLIPSLAIYLAYGVGLALGFRELGRPRSAPAGRNIALAALLVTLAVIVWRVEIRTAGFVAGDGRREWLTENTFNRRHQPFEADNTLVKIPAPSLVIEGNHPTLDGATAVFPVYAAAVQALYKNVDTTRVWNVIRSSTTPRAYDRLIAREVDLVFVAQPSPAQRAAAEAAGHPLQLTPIAKEAFVFFVHADNPVDGLTSEQIRAIYTKRIVNWREVGGRDEKIVPFQRPQGSGSQTALELKVMNGEKPAAPLREEFAEGMGGVIQQVAAYKNSREALGYSFRVYATAMNPDGAIKLLKVDGVAPTRETIRSGAYPYTVNLYAATAGTTNPHVPALLAWFLGPQGQQLIDQTGYVSLAP